jgi:uncharacterized small protein (DUF1192 family)
MKKVVVLTVFAAMVGSLYGQSVADLSKRERARRAALGMNRAKVVTNADLAAVRKTPAVVVGNPNAEPESEATVIPATAPSGADSGEVVMVPTVTKNGRQLFNDANSGPGSDAASRLKAANELIDLLTTKLNALMQQANNLDTMTPKDVIMKQIDETNQKLARVQDEAERLKAQIEAGKQNPPDKR